MFIHLLHKQEVIRSTFTRFIRRQCVVLNLMNTDVAWYLALFMSLWKCQMYHCIQFHYMICLRNWNVRKKYCFNFHCDLLSLKDPFLFFRKLYCRRTAHGFAHAALLAPVGGLLIVKASFIFMSNSLICCYWINLPLTFTVQPWYYIRIILHYQAPGWWFVFICCFIHGSTPSRLWLCGGYGVCGARK